MVSVVTGLFVAPYAGERYGHLGEEVYADGCLVLVVECVVHEARYEGCLADCRPPLVGRQVRPCGWVFANHFAPPETPVCPLVSVWRIRGT